MGHTTCVDQSPLEGGGALAAAISQAELKERKWGPVSPKSKQIQLYVVLHNSSYISINILFV